MSAITLFAYEPQPIVLEGLRRILDGVEDLYLAGTATQAAEALQMIRDSRPQIALLDQSGGLKQAFRLLTDSKAASPGTLAVLWVTEMSEVECFRALQLGAHGILKKTLPVASVLECLRAVAKGSVWIEHSVSSQVVGFLSRRQGPQLTPREREIVRCLCRGMRNKEIAGELSITPGTVKVHLMHIFEKTGVKDRFELAVHGRKLLGLDAGEDLVLEPASSGGD
ncbi:MAG: response regulator transcription factor [Acidobacteria bacterium]|nr:response regulator transcription factor [Acidobacteriota bacterium]